MRAGPVILVGLRLSSTSAAGLICRPGTDAVSTDDLLAGVSSHAAGSWIQQWAATAWQYVGQVIGGSNDGSDERDSSRRDSESQEALEQVWHGRPVGQLSWVSNGIKTLQTKVPQYASGFLQKHDPLQLPTTHQHAARLSEAADAHGRRSGSGSGGKQKTAKQQICKAENATLLTVAIELSGFAALTALVVVQATHLMPQACQMFVINHVLLVTSACMLPVMP